MAQEPILSVLNGGVLEITLNRPDVLNSFNREMATALRGAIEKGAAQTAVRSVLLTGAGRAFCAGQDLSEVSPRPDGSIPELGPIVRENYNPIIRALRHLEKPVVCAVNGIAAGAGANLAFACDVVFASHDASFIQSFSKVGLIPDSGGTFILPRLVGFGRASALMMLAEKVSAEDAASMGMIYKVVESSALLEVARKTAESLSLMPTRGLALTKKLLNASAANNIDAQLSLEEEAQHAAGKSDDYREGVVAFLEKRKPEFTGR